MNSTHWPVCVVLCSIKEALFLFCLSHPHPNSALRICTFLKKKPQPKTHYFTVMP